MSNKENYRMFSYPKKIWSTTVDAIPANLPIRGFIPTGGIFMILAMLSACVFAALAFFIGAVVDGIKYLSDSPNSEVTPLAP